MFPAAVRIQGGIGQAMDNGEVADSKARQVAPQEVILTDHAHKQGEMSQDNRSPCPEARHVGQLVAGGTVRSSDQSIRINNTWVEVRRELPAGPPMLSKKVPCSLRRPILFWATR